MPWLHAQQAFMGDENAVVRKVLSWQMAVLRVYDYGCKPHTAVPSYRSPTPCAFTLEWQCQHTHG